MGTSMGTETKLGTRTFVNDYQRAGFAKYSLKNRDPMFATTLTLLELETFTSPESLRNWCAGVNLDMLLKEAQWLREGMTDDEVQRAFKTRTGKDSMVTADNLEKLRASRAANQA